MDACLEENEIVDLVTGNLDAEASERAEMHIDCCTSCRVVLIELARVFELRASSLPAPESQVTQPSEAGTPLLFQTAAMMRGAEIGRYVVLEVLGAGAMGVVYAAYDPELDRRVALKLLRGRSLDDTAAERLIREARATAKLAHPNVVVVHDVGKHDGHVFMAMEYVQGGTLGEWLGARDRTRVDILRAYLAAGEGLAAAHAAELVHRDFKPANVLVGSDDRVRVTDFGLAKADLSLRMNTEPGTEPGTEPLASPSADTSVDDLTRTGALVGTPAYMSPEQIAGTPADARSDQFSYCVALSESLTGERPFAGKTFAELAANVTAGRVREAGPFASLPRDLRKVLLRGMSAAPSARYPDMRALLRDLSRTGTLRRGTAGTRWLFVGTVGLAATGFAWTATRTEAAPRFELCEAGAASLQDTWSTSRADEVQAALGSSGASGGQRIAQRVRTSMDSYADAWVAARTLACEDRDAYTAPQRHVVVRCLDESVMEFDALATAFVDGEAAALEHALDALSRLREPQTCAEVDWRRPSRVPEPEPAMADAVAAVRRDLALGDAYERTGQFERATRQTTQALADAKALGFQPLLAHAYFLRGMVHMELSEYAEAETALRESFGAALASDDDELMVEAGGLLLHSVGYSQGDAKAAEVWTSLTAAAIERLGADHPAVASYWDSVGNVAQLQGRFDDARAAFERALVVRRAQDSKHPSVVYSLANLAALEISERKFAAAETRSRELIALMTELFGADHPNLVAVYSTLASALVSQERVDEAAEAIDRSLTLGESVFGADHPRLQQVRVNLAMIRKRQGDLVSARDLYASVLAAWQTSRGVDDPNVGLLHNNLAATLLELGEPEEALKHHRRTLEIWEKAHGPEHARVGLGNSAVAVDLMALQRCDEAYPYAKRASAIAEGLELTDVLRGALLNTRAKVELCQQHPSEALAFASQALTAAEAAGGSSSPTYFKVRATRAEAAFAAGALETAREDAAVVVGGLPERGKPSATRARVLALQAKLAPAAEAPGLAKQALEALPPANPRWAELETELRQLRGAQ